MRRLDRRIHWQGLAHRGARDMGPPVEPEGDESGGQRVTREKPEGDEKNEAVGRVERSDTRRLLATRIFPA